MKWLLATWLALIALAWLFLPAFHGTIEFGAAAGIAIPIYAIVAGVTAISVKPGTGSARSALIAALPATGLLVLAAAAAAAIPAGERGEPIFLYRGIATLVSWAALVALTAGRLRARWSGLGGIAATMLLATWGYFLLVAQID